MMESANIHVNRLPDWIQRAFKSRKAIRGAHSALVGRFQRFQEILSLNNQILQHIADANNKLSGDYVFDQRYVHTSSKNIIGLVEKLVYTLDALAPGKYRTLRTVFTRIQTEIEQELSGHQTKVSTTFVINYNKISHNSMDEVGAKSANLAKVHSDLGLKIPRGFALTASAYHAFMTVNSLEPMITGIYKDWKAEKISLNKASATIQSRIQSCSLPAKLEHELNSAVNSLIQGRRPLIALRSSAWHEDRQHSFAGQYKTVLNIPAAEVRDAYRKVLASLYSENAMVYRHEQGYREHEVAMPVACQEMIDASVSGVLYTRDPSMPERDTLIMNATWGLGLPLVSGEAGADRFTVSRGTSLKITSIHVARKKTALRLNMKGGTRIENIEPRMQSRACLSIKQVLEVAEAGVMIENAFRQPHDIEFAFDELGQLFILQARPLALRPSRVVKAKDLAEILSNRAILLKEQGEIAQRGIASGPVFVIESKEDLDSFPDGAVLVAKTASPVLAKVLSRAAALLTDVGMVTGHLATVAREFRVPSILNCGNVSTLLSSGQSVTVDAEDNIVYEGIVPELRDYALTEEPIEETYEYRLLRRVLKKIEPLRLVEPFGENFTPEDCHSLHDITRFVHEKAVEELIRGTLYRGRAAKRAPRLDWHIPLDLFLIDIGGGLQPGAGNRITPKEIISTPMKAILRGIAVPGAWDSKPMSVDFTSFMSSLTRTTTPELAKTGFSGQNLAVLSSRYVNLSLRLGYHFTMIDSYASERVDDNYIYFRFFGGVTDAKRRSRRAQFLADSLALNDFRVELQGDLVIGRLKGMEERILMNRLFLLGVMISFTRQLDLRMINDNDVSRFVEKFKTIVEESDGHKNQHFDLG